MAYKSSWTQAQIAEARALLKLHPPRIVGEMIGRTARQITNKFNSYKATRAGASLAEKSKYVKIPCMQCGNDFLSWDRAKNRRCVNCKKRDDSSTDSHRLGLSPSYGNVRGGE